MSRVDDLKELVRFHARKWRLGYSVERVADSDEYEVRFGKALPDGLMLHGKPADSYYCVVRVRPEMPYWGTEIASAVEVTVEALVQMLEPHPSLEVAK